MSESLGSRRNFLKGDVTAESPKKKASVEVKIGKPIGEGGYGTASEAAVTVKSADGSRERAIPLVFKEMHTNEDFEKRQGPQAALVEDIYARAGIEYMPPPPYDQEKAALHAFEMYTLAKDAGLAVAPTFRLAREQKGILMTDLNRLFPGAPQGFSSYDLIQKDVPPIRKIRDLDAFITSLLDEGRKAAEAHIEIKHEDAYFLLPNPETGEIRFVAFDFDKFSSKPDLPPAELLRINLDSLAQLAGRFVRRQRVADPKEWVDNQKIFQEVLLARITKEFGSVDYSRWVSLRDFPKPLDVRLRRWRDTVFHRHWSIDTKLELLSRAIFKKNYW